MKNYTLRNRESIEKLDPELIIRASWDTSDGSSIHATTKIKYALDGTMEQLFEEIDCKQAKKKKFSSRRRVVAYFKDLFKAYKLRTEWFNTPRSKYATTLKKELSSFKDVCRKIND